MLRKPESLLKRIVYRVNRFCVKEVFASIIAEFRDLPIISFI